MISTTITLAIVSYSSIAATGTAVGDSSSDKWTFLGAVVTTLIAPVVIYLVGSRALKPPSRSSEETPAPTNTVSTDSGNSFSIEGMSSNTVEVLLSMWKKMDELEATQKNWALEREEFIKINEELRRHNRALAEGFDEVIDWIDAGSVPPPPSVAQHVRDLVQRAIEEGYESVRNQA